MKHFILMADIKDSRKKNSKPLIAKFRALITAINEKNKKHLLSPLTITLGDEFQCIVNDLSNSMKLITDLEEEIIRESYDFKLRYVLHYGEIDTSINKKNAYAMLGPGLTQARERLNGVKKTDSRFLIELHDDKKNKLFNNSFIVYQDFIDEWKNRDFKIVKAFIEQKGYKEVSKIIKLDPSSAWRREKSLKIKQYFAIKDIILSLSN